MYGYSLVKNVGLDNSKKAEVKTDNHRIIPDERRAMGMCNGGEGVN